MDILENFVKDDFDVDKLFPVDRISVAKSEASARNDAALTALLEPGQNPIDTYRLLYDESLRGKDEFAKLKGDNILKRRKQSDTGVAMQILSDDSIPDEKKRSALQYLSQHEPSLAESFLTRLSVKDRQSFNSEADKVADVGRNFLHEELAYREAAQAVLNGARKTLDTSVAFNKADPGYGEQMVPLGSTYQTATLLSDIQKDLGIDVGILGKFSQAVAKSRIIDALNNMPAEERFTKLAKMKDKILGNSGIIVRNKNDVEAMTLLSQLGEGDYSTTEKVADTVFQVLDVIGVGQLLKGGAKGAVKILKPAPVIKDVPSPLSPLELSTVASPDQAKGLYKAIVESPSEEAAMALANASKVDTILHVEGVKPLDEAITASIVKPNGAAEEIEALRSLVRQGGLQFDDAEVVAGLNELRTKFNAAKGISQYDNYTQIGIDGDAYVVRSVYGNGYSGGFLTADEALERARYQFKDFTIRDEDLSIIARKPGGKYEKVDINEVKGVEGDYLVQLDFRSPLEVSKFTPLQTKWNWLDRIPWLRSRFTGSGSRLFVDAASILPKNLTGAMENAVDYATSVDKYVVGIADDFAKSRKALHSNEQLMLNQVIKDSDAQRIEFPDSVLKGQYGLSDEGIDALKIWRKAQDTNHWLANLTYVKQLNNENYMKLVNNNAQLYGKPIPKNSNIGKVYDPELDSVRKLSSQELDDLYEQGGTIARMKSTESINGEDVSYFITTNKQGNYLRKLTDSDQVLNYIPGYYHRYYESPRFVVKKGVNADGQEYEKAIAVSATWQEAEAFLKRMAAYEGKSVEDFGRVRGDIKDVAIGAAEEWDLRATSGAINQRHRGEILTNAASNVHLSNESFVLNPMESLIRASSAIARKVALQDVIDNAKSRLMSEFKNILPKDGSYPTSWQQIGLAGDMGSTEAKNARALWDYIDQMEIGYYEGIDALTKNIFNTLADELGKAGHMKAERASLAASRLNPMSSISSFVHSAMIKWNPLRQWVVQPIQTLQLYAYDHVSALKTSKDLVTLGNASFKKIAGQALSVEEKQLDDFVHSWGGFAGVDRQIMVDGPLRELVHNENMILRGLGKIDKMVGQIGFDFSEKTNLLNHALTVRNRFIRLGKDVTDKRVIDEITAETRALTGSMNEAGAMPYNKTTPAIFMKFLQIPQKGLLKVTTNQRLTPGVKARIATYDALLYGVPITSVAAWMDKDVLSEDPDVREVQLFGALTWAYNKAFKNLFKTEGSNINAQSLGPYETSGWRELITNFMDGGMNKMLANTPAGSLVMGSNPRLTNALHRTMSALGVGDYKDNPAKFGEVIQDWARISSGASHLMNTYYMINANKELTKTGAQLREGISNWDVLHEMFGMQTTKEASAFAVMDDARKIKKQRTEEIQAHVDFVLRIFKDRYNEANSDPEKLVTIFKEVNRTFAHDNAAMDIAHKHLLNRIKTTDDWFPNMIFQYAGILTKEQLSTNLKRSGMPEEQITKYLNILNDMYDEQTAKEFDKYEKESEK